MLSATQSAIPLLSFNVGRPHAKRVFVRRVNVKKVQFRKSCDLRCPQEVGD